MDIVVQPSDNYSDGIFKHIQKSGKNPLNYVKLSMSGTQKTGEISYIVLQTNNFQVYGPLAWIQLDFKERRLFPTHYSLRSIISDGGWTYSLNWTVLGFNDENKNNQNKWDVISLGSSTDVYCKFSFYCYPNGQTELYSFDNKKLRNYRYIRWNTTKGSYNSYLTFSTSGLEIFGRLFDYNKCTLNRGSRRVSNFVFICLLVMLC